MLDIVAAHDEKPLLGAQHQCLDDRQSFFRRGEIPFAQLDLSFERRGIGIVALDQQRRAKMDAERQTSDRLAKLEANNNAKLEAERLALAEGQRQAALEVPSPICFLRFSHNYFLPA